MTRHRLPSSGTGTGPSHSRCWHWYLYRVCSGVYSVYSVYRGESVYNVYRVYRGESVYDVYSVYSVYRTLEVVLRLLQLQRRIVHVHFMQKRAELVECDVSFLLRVELMEDLHLLVLQALLGLHVPYSELCEIYGPVVVLVNLLHHLLHHRVGDGCAFVIRQHDE